MTRRLTFIIGLGAALAFPAIASADCGTTQGSFSVTCTDGVKVYRHNALSGIPRSLTPAQASLQSAQLRADTDRLRIQSQERTNLRNQTLRERELAQDRIRSRIFDRNSRSFSNSSFRSSGFNRGGFNNGFGFSSGFNGSHSIAFGQPSRVRTGLKNTKH